MLKKIQKNNKLKTEQKENALANKTCYLNL